MDIHPNVKVDLTFSVTLTEVEARALRAITVYGPDQFLETFYEKLGETYLKPHESGIRTVFNKFGGAIEAQLKSADAAREVLKEGFDARTGRKRERIIEDDRPVDVGPETAMVRKRT